jgi:hypothetical protein
MLLNNDKNPKGIPSQPRTAAVSETSRSNVRMPTVHEEPQRSSDLHWNHNPRPPTNAAVVLPLPKGEGWGEGEGIVCQPNLHAPAHRIRIQTL